MSLAKDDLAPFLSEQFSRVFVNKPGNIPPERVLVHCGGGLGRTGTMMAIINSFIPINEFEAGGLYPKEFRLSIFSIVRRLKEQRYGLVKNEAQYKFIYDMIKEYMKNPKETVIPWEEGDLEQ